MSGGGGWKWKAGKGGGMERDRSKRKGDHVVLEGKVFAAFLALQCFGSELYRICVPITENLKRSIS